MESDVNLSPIREVKSDTEEESHGRVSLNRKADLLNIHDANQEFELKSNCLRRKSLDFDRDLQRQKAKLKGPSNSFHINKLNKLTESFLEYDDS